jgi:predicted amidohydrolase YtcJ
MLILGAEISSEIECGFGTMRPRESDSGREGLMDLRCEGGRIVELARHITPRPGEFVLEAKGGALIPGLHDHHLHLLALAADLASTPCGPPQVESRSALADALHRATPVAGWLRGTGYFESVAGPLDRRVLDTIAPSHPLRIQHRSGAMWFLNSRAIDALGLDRTACPAGVERDESGRATGRLFRSDGWLRERLPATRPPDLVLVGARLASAGVTSVTDATPSNGRAEAGIFREAQRSGALLQRLHLMGDLSLGGLSRHGRSREDLSARDVSAKDLSTRHEGDDGIFEVDAHKILLDEPILPELDRLVAQIEAAHDTGRSVAIHCVTRTEMHFALAALDAAGVLGGDRIEHASVAPAEAVARVKQLGVRIATQPNFVAERGDAYRSDVAVRDFPHLYRVRSWIDAGVPLAGGTDAPFGDPDPWHAMHAAVHRRSRSGEILGATETVSPEVALSLFTKGFGKSGGGRADLCLLDAPWRRVREDLSKDHVVATLRAGKLIWSRAT